MSFSHFFERYELLAARADEAFHAMEQRYGECVRCELHCADCCYAVFGLFLIEALYVQHHFQRLSEELRREALVRAEEAEAELHRIQDELEPCGDNPRIGSQAMGKARIRCPLLDDRLECILYPCRPITCRVYGIPTLIRGRAHVCGKTRFTQGEVYPTFKLDVVERELHALSEELLRAAGDKEPEKASLLLSVPEAIKNPMNLHMFSRASEAT
jgi:Fe-S-cluster containining protein